MKLSVALIALNIAASALAQSVTSPDVAPDGRVTFRLWAPRATSVQVHCEGVKASEMEKNDAGVWSLTTEPLQPDIYAYSFTVDGVKTLDPRNPLIKYNLLNIDSQVHVPGPASLPWEVNDVPHGVVHHHFYKSAIAGDERDYYVYTPPGYDPAQARRYPVLYLLHGYSDAADAWTSVGLANVILDNLIARGEARPMIVVMPLGYGTMEVVTGGWGRLRNRNLWQTNLEKFQKTLLDEVLPRVDAAYKTEPRREDRAIAGLSMGGAESLLTGLNSLNQFAYVGAFSSGGLGADFSKDFPGLDKSANAKLRLLWIGCGEQDGLFAPNQRFCDWLTAQGIHHAWVHIPGQHSFRVWRPLLAKFAPLLFQEASGSDPNL